MTDPRRQPRLSIAGTVVSWETVKEMKELAVLLCGIGHQLVVKEPLRLGETIVKGRTPVRVRIL